MILHYIITISFKFVLHNEKWTVFDKNIKIYKKMLKYLNQNKCHG